MKLISNSSRQYLTIVILYKHLLKQHIENKIMNFTKYENQLPYPSTPSRKCECGYINDENAKFCNYCGEKLTYSDRLKMFRNLQNEYSTETYRLESLFKTDLLDYLDITDNPKADLLFDKAWKMGHSYSLNEVITYAEDLVDLIH